MYSVQCVAAFVLRVTETYVPLSYGCQVHNVSPHRKEFIRHGVRNSLNGNPARVLDQFGKEPMIFAA